MPAAIGAGRLRDGNPHPSGKAEYPRPWPIGTPIGEYLRVEGLLRLAEGRQIYVASNKDPLWTTTIKCWTCGHRRSPPLANHCAYCFSPLGFRRFLVAARWDARDYQAFEDYARLGVDLDGVVEPVGLMVREGRMLAVYPYGGESLLLDEPAAMPVARLVSVWRDLAESLGAIHKRGVVLKGITPGNVLLHPNGQARWFDLDVAAVLPDEGEVSKAPGNPARRDVAQLARILLRLVGPETEELQELLLFAVQGRFLSPRQFLRGLDSTIAKGGLKGAFPHGAAYSDLGLVRDHNEDSWGWRRVGKATLNVVADGMGGHDAGEIASEIAVRTVCDHVTKAEPADSKTAEKVLTAAITDANKAVLAEADRLGAKMGTTIVSALVFKGLAVVAHVGDSRCYHFSQGKLKAVTTDHTIGAQLLAAKKITADQLSTHPRANMLTSALGGEEEDLECDVVTLPVKPGDRLLLCSDGLWGELSDEEISAVLSEEFELNDAVVRLVREAYGHEGSDNVSVILVDVA